MDGGGGLLQRPSSSASDGQVKARLSLQFFIAFEGRTWSINGSLSLLLRAFLEFLLSRYPQAFFSPLGGFHVQADN